MNIPSLPKIRISALALSVAVTSPAVTQEIEEARSTVNATYVAESATDALEPGARIENIFNKNVTQNYILQKLTDRIWFFQRQHAGTIFYVGDEGVMIFDALAGATNAINEAIAEVTDLPITALLYSHNHNDHIGDASVLAEQIPSLRIIATEATVEVMERLGSNHPKPTETINADTNTFSFEALTVRVVPLEHSGHARDHAIYIPEGTGVIHAPDIFNPDQPPFWSFAGAESYIGYRDMVETVGSLEWDYLSAAHGNVGYRDDIEFYLTYLDDIEAAVGEAFANLARDTGLEHPEAINNHAAYTSTWMSALGQYVTDVLRPTYGDYYGFEYSTPTNAQMVAWFLMMYR